MTELEEKTDKELVKHIQDLQAEADELYNERSFDVLKKKDELIGAMKEAENRGYETLEDLKESL